ncbi:hypothetical protein Tco_0205377 [Tanacetum coccineum]
MKPRPSAVGLLGFLKSITKRSRVRFYAGGLLSLPPRQQLTWLPRSQVGPYRQICRLTWGLHADVACHVAAIAIIDQTVDYRSTIIDRWSGGGSAVVNRWSDAGQRWCATVDRRYPPPLATVDRHR